METSSRPLVLFHDQCMDGLAAAWVAWRRHFENADYVPVRYGEKVPKCEDRVVYILDFCYPVDATTRIADEASRVIIIDHHATAIERFKAQWKERPDVHCVFDITRSGAALTSEYFNAQARIWVIDYVEDRDLWKFELPHSKEINALFAASCLGKPTLEAFKILNELRGLSRKEAVLQGTGAQLQIECYARQVALEARRIDFAGYPKIPIVNLSKPMASDALHVMAKTALFAVGWAESRGKAVFSLRSEGAAEGFNCRELAERFGGGGHHNAAGFTLPFSEVEKTIMGQP